MNLNFQSSWKLEEISTIAMIRWLLQNTSRIATPKTLTAGPKLAPRWHHHPRRIGKPVLVTNIVFLLVEHCDQTSRVEGPDEKTGRPIAVLRESWSTWKPQVQALHTRLRQLQNQDSQILQCEHKTANTSRMFNEDMAYS